MFDPEGGVPRAMRIAAAATIGWIVLVALLVGLIDGAAVTLAALGVVFLPVALLWVGAALWQALAQLDGRLARLEHGPSETMPRPNPAPDPNTAESQPGFADAPARLDPPAVRASDPRPDPGAVHSGSYRSVSVSYDDLSPEPSNLDQADARDVAARGRPASPPRPPATRQTSAPASGTSGGRAAAPATGTSKTATPTARPARTARPAEPQLELPGTEVPEPPPVPHVVRALHFPESEDDREGLRALRAALRDPTTARLIQASQDVLTLLAQSQIYTDALEPEIAPPEIWRRFARGERGPVAGGVGGIRDPEPLAIAADRLRDDAIFRDAAHHFLRLFDRNLAAIEPRARDADLRALAETRTARAFMLLGRAAGSFD